MNRRWTIKRVNPDYVSYLSRAANISPVFSQVLINRGLKTPHIISDFLYAGISGLSDPYEFPGMKAAVERIRYARDSGERIFVHGDYDADGITAAALMVHALKQAGAEVEYFIPNRMVHGYGFNAPSIEVAQKHGATLIITVDCGITSFETAAYAKRAGIDVIVTDHHEPLRQQMREGETGSSPFILPDAVAVINPRMLNDSRVTSLSGAGTAFKVVQALALDNAFPLTMDDVLPLLDLAALGTVADVVPLIGENRIILKEGLRYVQTAHRPAIRSLIEVTGLSGKELRAGLLSYVLVPRINAQGRIGDPSSVMRLFLSPEPEETLALAAELDKKNTERQQIEEEIYQEAYLQLQKKGYDAAVVLTKEGWHLGVLGIVASRIAEQVYRPTFLLTIEHGVAKGSARSIPPFNIHEGLTRCSDLLLSFGGHKQAAGVRLREADIPLFEKRINAVVREFLSSDDFIPTLEVDAEVALSDVHMALLRELFLLEPFGCGNPEPLFGAKRLDMTNLRIVGKNHLKMTLRQRSQLFDAIGFNMGDFLSPLSASATIDAVFTPTINEWNGGRHLQLTIKGVRPGE